MAGVFKNTGTVHSPGATEGTIKLNQIVLFI
jgi:hypothetical protein